ncbi:MAG: hypothetical protein KatS3mg026_0622 [Bacteroidia bacterium]|nr:MAG: hypothetical protein KatS3mg026_0622 [Bacteroidia bacterium]
MGLYMGEVDLWRYLSVGLMSGLKFMVGVAMSAAFRFSFWEQFLTTSGGGIAGVVFFTYLGDWIRRQIARWRGRPAASLSPRWARLWERYGLWGVAFLTPPILSPPLGTAIALAFGTPRPHIVARMTLAMIFWGFFFAGLWESLQQFIPF